MEAFKAVATNPLLMAIAFIIGGLFVLTWVFMILDCLIHDFEHSGNITGRPKLDKFIWTVFVILIPGIGALVYYLVVRRKSRRV